MAIHGDTELSTTKQDLIAAEVQKEIQFRALLSGFFTDVSRFAVKGAKSISFPKLTSFTAADRASAVAGVPQVVTASVDILELSKTPYVSWIIDSNDEVQSTLEFQVEAARRSASAHGRRLDNEIILELEAAGVATAVAGDVTRDIALDMREQYLDNEGFMEEAIWIVSGDQETALLKIDEFKNQDIYGQNGVVRTGQMGSLYGAPVVRHNGLPASTYYLAGRDGLAYGFQRSPAMDVQKAIEYGTGAELHAMDALMGIQAMLLGEGGVGAAESAHIIKDANV